MKEILVGRISHPSNHQVALAFYISTPKQFFFLRLTMSKAYCWDVCREAKEKN